MLATSSADLSMLLQGPRSPTSKRNPPTCCLISCEVKGVVYHQTLSSKKTRSCNQKKKLKIRVLEFEFFFGDNSIAGGMRI